MRTIKYILLAIVGLCLVIIGFANRDLVTLTLLPAEFVPFLQYNKQIQLPLFVVVFGGVAIGLLIGFILEWIRESRQRSEAETARRERARLSAEVQQLKKGRGSDKDDVLALLEDGGAVR